MKNIKNFEDVSNLPEVLELTKILIEKGYSLESFNNSDEDSVISLRLNNDLVVAEVEVSDRINMWVFIKGSQIDKNESNVNLDKESDNACDVMDYIAMKYKYKLSENGDSYYKE